MMKEVIMECTELRHYLQNESDVNLTLKGRKVICLEITVRTAQETHSISVIKTSQSVL
jgi:hypothetical protein